MSKAPERIGLIGDGMGNWALATVDEADVAIHYIRADLARVVVAAALREAAELMPPNWGAVRAEILALIFTDHAAALDKLIADAERRGMERAAEVAPKVKPLEWDGDEDDCFMTCDMGSRSYDLFVIDTLERPCDHLWKATYCEVGQRELALGGGSLTEAKAAAQADYEARILAALEWMPLPAAPEGTDHG